MDERQLGRLGLDESSGKSGSSTAGRRGSVPPAVSRGAAAASRPRASLDSQIRQRQQRPHP
jgi:hypothetical protein